MSTERDARTPSEEIRLLGQALKLLRNRAGLTQEEASANYGVTRGAWQNYENGRAVILRTDVQAKLAEALGSDREELLLQLAALTAPKARRGMSGLAERESRGFDLGDREQAVFQLGDGEATLTYPSDLTAEGLQELEDYLSLFFKSRRRRAG